MVCLARGMQDEAQGSTSEARRTENLGAKETCREERSLTWRLFVDDSNLASINQSRIMTAGQNIGEGIIVKILVPAAHIHLRYLLSFGTNVGYWPSV